MYWFQPVNLNKYSSTRKGIGLMSGYFCVHVQRVYSEVVGVHLEGFEDILEHDLLTAFLQDHTIGLCLLKKLRCSSVSRLETSVEFSCQSTGGDGSAAMRSGFWEMVFIQVRLSSASENAAMPQLVISCCPLAPGEGQIHETVHHRENKTSSDLPLLTIECQSPALHLY